MQYELKSTETFSRWISNLDKPSKMQLLSRLARIENGNFGDHKAITDNLFELRCFFLVEYVFTTHCEKLKLFCYLQVELNQPKNET
jgi:putative addiction module killer protein